MARLQHHSSIVMWDLNNEGQAMVSWGLDGDPAEYLRQYGEFFVRDLTAVMAESGVNLTRNFMDTSPSSGLGRGA